MNGKELKVTENDLTFGGKARMVNVFGVFRHKKSNGLYVLYNDVGANYNVIYYGSSHVKEHSILSMSCKPEDGEIIKEYIYKVTEEKELDSFEMISLDDVSEIEIISSNRLEIKPEVLSSLIELTIPKKEVPVEEEKNKKVKKKSPVKFLLFLVILACLGVGGYYFLFYSDTGDSIAKSVTCVKKYPHDTLEVTVEETNVYQFNQQDVLQDIETTQVFHFNTLNDYEEFIYQGTMYKYMPEDDTSGGFKQDDENQTFTFITRETVGVDYQKPTNYEEVLSYYKAEGYQCEEKILGE